MMNIIRNIIKKVLAKGSSDNFSTMLSKGATFERLTYNSVKVSFIRRDVVFLIYRKLSEAEYVYFLDIQTDIFNGRTPYYNGETKESKMSYDRIFFYLRTYLGY